MTADHAVAPRRQFGVLDRQLPSPAAEGHFEADVLVLVAGVRFVAAWVLAYPAGDLLTRHQDIDGVASMHALRSLPGLPGLALLAGLGAAAGGADAGSSSSSPPCGYCVVIGMVGMAVAARSWPW